MFVSYKDTEEKIAYIGKMKGNLDNLNLNWLLETLAQLNRKAERYEKTITNIANIDTRFLTPEGESNWDDQLALKEIEKMVQPIWEEVSSRKRNFASADKDLV